MGSVFRLSDLLREEEQDESPAFRLSDLLAPSNPLEAIGEDVRRRPRPETSVIPPEREREFADWVTQNRVTDLDQPESRYDYRGAFLAGVSRDAGPDGHFPDTFKQRGHPTFSDESRYAQPNDPLAGRWEGENYVPPPGPRRPDVPAPTASDATAMRTVVPPPKPRTRPTSVAPEPMVADATLARRPPAAPEEATFLPTLEQQREADRRRRAAGIPFASRPTSAEGESIRPTTLADRPGGAYALRGFRDLAELIAPSGTRTTVNPVTGESEEVRGLDPEAIATRDEREAMIDEARRAKHPKAEFIGQLVRGTPTFLATAALPEAALPSVAARGGLGLGLRAARTGAVFTGAEAIEKGAREGELPTLGEAATAFGTGAAFSLGGEAVGALWRAAVGRAKSLMAGRNVATLEPTDPFVSAAAGDPYRTLGLDAQTATAEGVEAAWKEQVQRWHPDRNPGDRFANDRTSIINTARDAANADLARRAPAPPDVTAAPETAPRPRPEPQPQPADPRPPAPSPTASAVPTPGPRPEVPTEVVPPFMRGTGLPVPAAEPTLSPEAAAERAGIDREREELERTDPEKQGRAGPRSPRESFLMPLAQLRYDPERFQFKEQGLGARGDALADVEKWDYNKEGVLLIWRDPADGFDYVINGHNRYKGAARLGETHLPVKYVEAETAQQARAIGALNNISEGRGTAVDVAKVFRDIGATPESLRATGTSLSEGLAESGLALSKLTPDIFEQVARGEFPERHGVAIGSMLTDPVMQREAASAVRGRGRMSEAEVREVARQVRDAGTEEGTQETLFGTETERHSIFRERAEIAVAVLKRMGGDRRLFGFVSKEGRAEQLGRAEGTTINVEAAKAIAEGSARVEETFYRLYTRSGPIGTMVTEAARRRSRGEKTADIVEDIYPALGEAVARELSGAGVEGGEAPTGRSGSEPTRAPEGPAEEVAPPPFVDPSQEGMFDAPARPVPAVPGAAAASVPATPQPPYRIEDLLAEPEAASEAISGPSAVGDAAPLAEPPIAASGAPGKPGKVSRASGLPVTTGEPSSSGQVPAKKGPPRTGKPKTANPMDVRNAGVDVYNTALRTLYAMTEGQGLSPGSPQLALTRIMDGGESIIDAYRAEGITATPEIIQQAQKVLRLDAATEEAGRAAGLVPWEDLKAARAELARQGMNEADIQALGQGPEVIERAFREAPAGSPPQDFSGMSDKDFYDQTGGLKSTDPAVLAEEARRHAANTAAREGRGAVETPIRQEILRRLEGEEDFDALRGMGTPELIEWARDGGLLSEAELAAITQRAVPAASASPSAPKNKAPVTPQIAPPAGSTPMGMKPATDAEIVDRPLADASQSALFGPEAMGPEPEPGQEGLFGDREGTAAARNLKQTEASARGDLEALKAERDLLQGRIRMMDAAGGMGLKAPQRAETTRRLREVSAQITEREKLVNRGKAISAEEMATRAEAEDVPDVGDDLNDQPTLLSPERPVDPLREKVEHLLSPEPGAAGAGKGQPIGYMMHGNVETPADWKPGDSINRAQVMGLIGKIAEAAGRKIAMRVGRMGQRNALGQFAVRPEVIRIQAAHDITTAAHEIGHATEKIVFGWPKGGPWKAPFATKPMQRELFALGKKLYGDVKPKGGYKREGFAEFWRMWIEDDPALKTAAPDFLNWFEGEFFGAHPEIKEAAEAAREGATTWRKQGAMERARVSMVDPASPMERVKKAVETVRRGISMEKWVEMAQPLYDLAKEAETRSGQPLAPSSNPYTIMAALRTTQAARVKYMVENGMIDLAGNRVGPALNEIRALAQGQQKAFTLYLWARRSLALWNDPKGEARNPGLSAEDAEQIIKELRSPNFELAAGKVYDWNAGVLNYAAQASPSFREVIEKVRERDPGNYIPLQRMMEELDDLWARSAGRTATSRSPVKWMLGSGRRIKEPFPQMIAQAEQTVRAAHARLVIDQIVKLSRIEGMGHLVEEVPVNEVPVAATTIKDLIERIERELNGPLSQEYSVDVKSGFGGVDKDLLEKTLTFFAPAQRPNGVDPVVPIYEEGAVHWYRVDGKLYDTLASLDVYRLPQVASLPLLEWALAKPAAFFRAGTTGLRASFGLIWNPLRDAQSLWVNSHSSANGPKLLAYWSKAMFDSMLNRGLGLDTSEWLQTFIRLGGEMAQPLGQDIPHTRLAARRLFQGRTVRTLDPRNWFEWFREIVQAPEMAPRVAELRAYAKDIGWEPGQPMTLDQSLDLLLKAKQVTTDFSAAGEIARVTNRMVPFHNSAIQGPRASLRATRHHPGRFVARGLALTAATLLLWWTNKDEEWYIEQNPRDKFLHWFFPVEIDGQKTLARIPRAFEVGLLFSALPEALADSWYRQDPEGFTDWFKVFVETSMPNMTPVLPGVAAEQLANKRFHFDTPIVPMGDQRRPAPEQFNEYTSRVAIKLGHVFNVSPRRVDHAIEGVAGPVAKDILDIFGRGISTRPHEEEAADLPLVGRLFQRGGEIGNRPRSIERLYDELGEAQTVQQSTRAPETEDQRQRRLMLTDATQAVSALFYVRRFTSRLDRREELTHEALAIAKDALDAANASDDLRRATFSAARRRAEQQMEAAEREFEPSRAPAATPRARPIRPRRPTRPAQPARP